MTMGDKVEILSEDLIDQHCGLALTVLGASSRLGIPLGWHYLLDLIWILRELGDRRPLRILEIGGGMGLIQFILADHGHHVTSTDMRVREVPARIAALYEIRHTGSAQTLEHGYLSHHALSREPRTKGLAKRFLNMRIGDIPQGARSLLGAAKTLPKSSPPSHAKKAPLTFHRSLAQSMPELADSSFDAVISVSALEHNDPRDLPPLLKETARLVKPGGVVLHTVSGSISGEHFHTPSYSWLQDGDGFTKLYGLTDPQTNYNLAGEMMENLRASKYLKSQLAYTYFQSDKNGMPWGVWNPEYLPVGVRREVRA